MRTRNLTIAAAVGGAGMLAWKLLGRGSRLDLSGKLVLITGGSRGLGLQLCREFGTRGARVVFCARDEAELNRAWQDLTARGIEAHAIPCDVTDREQVERMIQQTVRDFGGIDVLVNNAGAIQVGPVSAMDVDDFKKAMDVMFWGAVFPTLAVLPSMRERGSGRIVNVTSIGGKVSVPHLLPYSCAKFAAVAFSEGLRSELAPAGIKVTTIVPGLMRTGSHLNARFKGNPTREYTWFSLGAATPIASVSAQRAARTIVQAAIRGDSEKVLSVPADLLARVHGLLPGLTASLMAAVNRLLPSAAVNVSGEQTGHEARARLNSRLLDAVNYAGQKAAEDLNELLPA